MYFILRKIWYVERAQLVTYSCQPCVWSIKETRQSKKFKPEPYFELNAEILANQQKFVAKLDPYQRFKDETGQ